MDRDKALAIQKYIQHSICGTGIDVSVGQKSRNNYQIEMLPCDYTQGIYRFNIDPDYTLAEDIGLQQLKCGSLPSWTWRWLERREGNQFDHRAKQISLTVDEICDLCSYQDHESGWENFVCSLLQSMRMAVTFHCGQFVVRRQISYDEDPFIKIEKYETNKWHDPPFSNVRELPHGNYIVILCSDFGNRKGTKGLPLPQQLEEDFIISLDGGLDFDELKEKIVNCIRSNFQELPSRF